MPTFLSQTLDVEVPQRANSNIDDLFIAIARSSRLLIFHLPRRPAVIRLSLQPNAMGRRREQESLLF